MERRNALPWAGDISEEDKKTVEVRSRFMPNLEITLSALDVEHTNSMTDSVRVDSVRRHVRILAYRLPALRHPPTPPSTKPDRYCTDSRTKAATSSTPLPVQRQRSPEPSAPPSVQHFRLANPPPLSKMSAEALRAYKLKTGVVRRYVLSPPLPPPARNPTLTLPPACPRSWRGT